MLRRFEMLLGFMFGMFVGAALIIFLNYLEPLVVYYHQDICDECKNMKATICKECSTELSKK